MLHKITKSLLCRGSRIASPLVYLNKSGVKPLHLTSVRNGEIFTVQDKKEFDSKVLKSKDYVVVDFYANWCGPCKMLAPKLEHVIGKAKDVHLAKINVDDLDELASEHEVSTIPAVFGFKDGKVVGKFIGNKEPDEIREFVDRLREA